MAASRAAALATWDPSTQTPLASLVAVTDDGTGQPLLLLSHLSEHTRALRAHARASLLFSATLEGATMDVARVCLSGAVRWLEGDEAERARERVLQVHPDAVQYAHLPGFSPVRLEVDSVRAIGGFARAATLDATAWRAHR